MRPHDTKRTKNSIVAGNYLSILDCQFTITVIVACAAASSDEVLIRNRPSVDTSYGKNTVKRILKSGARRGDNEFDCAHRLDARRNEFAHVDVPAAGLIGAIRDPSAIRRERRFGFVGGCDDEWNRLSVAGYGESVYRSCFCIG